MRKTIYFLLLYFFVYSIGAAQNIAPAGKFLKDSVQIGEPIEFVLSIKYPKEYEIIFPDSLYDFSPFELTKKSYFPTKSDSIFSVDSAIYLLTTFEIDTVQYLKLPVYKVNEFDSLILWTNLDSVVLHQVVTSIPDSVAMVTNTNYVEVPMAFNYPYASIGLAILLISSVILWVVFGKKVLKIIAIYRLKKKNTAFLNEFEALVATKFLHTEEILTLWKKYVEKLTGKPIAKLTTTETIATLPHQSLGEALMAIDKNIYGPKDESLLANAYQAIKDVAQEEYNTKVNMISNG